MALRRSLEHVRHEAQRRNHSEGFVYAMSRDDGAIKLGLTRNVENRIKDVRSYKANSSAQLIAVKRVGCMACAESILHYKFSAQRIPPCFFSGTEWFRITSRQATDSLAGVWS